jgi:putative NADH-flavin reductase
MRIRSVGANGNIGPWIDAGAQASGHEVIAFTRASAAAQGAQ